MCIVPDGWMPEKTRIPPCYWGRFGRICSGSLDAVTYVVTTPSFSGPVELLLQAIGRHELDVLDVPLGPVVDEFVGALRAGRVDPEELSEFVLVAAILLELKSRRLLPGADEPDPDEEFVLWEERDVLLARLLEMRTYAALGDALASIFERSQRARPRLRGLDDGLVVEPPDLLAGVGVADLARAYLRGIEERPAPVVRLHHVTVDAVTVAETVAALAARLPSMGEVTFRALTEGLATRIEVIVHFLALLELCKLGHVDLGQGRTFGEVTLVWREDAPSLTLSAVDDYDG